MKWLKYGLILSGLFALIIIAGGCKKGGGGSEQDLVVETLPVSNGHVETPAPGPDFPLKITVRSAMPPGGIKIDITAKPDGGNAPFFTQSSTNSQAVNNFIITGTSTGVVNVVDITVTSVSKSSNQWRGSYKYSRK